MSKAKDPRPFYKKKRFNIIIVIFTISMLIAVNGGNTTNQPDKTVVTKTDSETQTNNPEDTAPESTSNPKKDSLTLGQKNALSSAKNYLSFAAFSKQGLMKQLAFEGYSTEEATFAVENCQADWNEQAAKSAKNYLSISSFSKKSLGDQLLFEGYSQEEVDFALNAVGY